MTTMSAAEALADPTWVEADAGGDDRRCGRYGVDRHARRSVAGGQRAVRPRSSSARPVDARRVAGGDDGGEHGRVIATVGQRATPAFMRSPGVARVSGDTSIRASGAVFRRETSLSGRNLLQRRSSSSQPPSGVVLGAPRRVDQDHVRGAGHDAEPQLTDCHWCSLRARPREPARAPQQTAGAAGPSRGRDADGADDGPRGQDDRAVRLCSSQPARACRRPPGRYRRGAFGPQGPRRDGRRRAGLAVRDLHRGRPGPASPRSRCPRPRCGSSDGVPGSGSASPGDRRRRLEGGRRLPRGWIEPSLFVSHRLHRLRPRARRRRWARGACGRRAGELGAGLAAQAAELPTARPP